MKKPIIMITAAATAVIFALSAYGQKRIAVEDVQVEYIEDSENTDTDTSDYAKQNDKDTQQNKLADELEIDFTYDYSENIKADVDYVVSGSDTLQEELENIEKIIQKYTPLAQAAQTQGEMNVSSQWFFVIWDTELNSLWSRFSNSADQQTKEKVLFRRDY
ncbi:MAG: hypothetical protein NC433_11880 [Clostridiales bacterium]|nr:hypothetical protein [Clostridiales bacterium]